MAERDDHWNAACSSQAKFRSNHCPISKVSVANESDGMTTHESRLDAASQPYPGVYQLHT